jgi:hypothetical protein
MHTRMKTPSRVTVLGKLKEPDSVHVVGDITQVSYSLHLLSKITETNQIPCLNFIFFPSEFLYSFNIHSIA